MLLTNEAVDKIRQIVHVCNAAPSEFIMNCETTSLKDPAVQKLMRQFQHIVELL